VKRRMLGKSHRLPASSPVRAHAATVIATAGQGTLINRTGVGSLLWLKGGAATERLRCGHSSRRGPARPVPVSH
jgi:hypothetical protein